LSNGNRKAQAIVIFAALALGYFLSMFFRASLGVIGPDLMRDPGISPESLGLIASLFFIAFAALQVPIGLALDRFGPRLVVSTLLVFAAAGSAVFAAAPDAAILGLGRVLMGIGCSAVLMAALVVFARWFPQNRFATATGLFIGLGGIGLLAATAPLAEATAAIGWRRSFFIMGVLTLAIAGLIAMVTRDAPPGHAWHSRQPEPAGVVLSGLVEVLRDGRIYRLLAMGFVAASSALTVLSLWGGPYLTDIHGLDLIERGQILLGMSVAAVCSSFAYGPLDRVFNTHKWLVVSGAIACASILATLALVPTMALWQAASLFILLGLFGGLNVQLIAHTRSLFPERLVGRCLTTVNIALMGGVGVMQLLTGLLVSAFPREGTHLPLAAYQAVFGSVAGALVVALAIYIRIDDVKPNPGPTKASR